MNIRSFGSFRFIDWVQLLWSMCVGRLVGSQYGAKQESLESSTHLALSLVLAAVIVATGLLPKPATATDISTNQGYLVDQHFKVVTSGTGLCWRTSDWTPARAAAAPAGKFCDPDLQPKPAAAPVRSIAAPPPPPAPKVQPRKVVPRVIHFSADALFDFDKANLKPKGKAMLDRLAHTLQGAKYDMILAIGHTDRIGTVAYNLKLSARRAESVKKYLVEKGIDPGRIHAEGKGKSEPITKPSDCRGKRGRALIKCYQPDRRVDVEVKATK